MKITTTLQPLIDASRREIPALIKQLQVGQTLDAKVLAQLRPGVLRLQIATTELLARSPQGLQAGTRLRLEVVKGLPLPELRILREQAVPDRKQQIVRSAMSRQLPTMEVRQSLAEMRPRTQTREQTEGIRQLATILEGAGVRLNRLNPVHLRRAIAHSGLFHEARLAAALPGDPADTKTRLLQLLPQLAGNTGLPREKPTGPPAPGNEQSPAARDPAGDSLLNRLIRLVEGSVSRIQLHQAAALPSEDGQRQVWQLDLPIQLPDETHDAMLRIERGTAHDDEGAAPGWAVNLAFQFDSIGSLQCRIALAGDRVSATFWAERGKTHQTVEKRLPGLREAFEAQGLEVVHLAGVLGAPPEPLIRVPMPETLLDERA